MAKHGYLFLEAAKQKEIESNIDKDGKEGGIEFYNFEHLIEIPHTQGSSRIGHATHGCISITKEVDITTPKLYRVICTEEPISQAILQWFHFNEGVERIEYSIILTHVKLVGIKSFIDDVRSDDHSNYRMSEKLELEYRTISWAFGGADENSSESSFMYDRAMGGKNKSVR